MIMTTEIFARNNDVLAIYVQELNEILAQQELHEILAGVPLTPGHQASALRAAIALGYCRLFGADLGDEDGALPLPIAKAATTALHDLIDDAAKRAQILAHDWDSTDEPIERDELCVRLLLDRMDIHAAYIAVDEALLEAYGDQEISWQEYDSTLQALTEKAEQLDVALQQPGNLEILSTVAHLPLIENWRILLTQDHHGLMPWWLSGLLSEVAQVSMHEALKRMPSAGIWQTVARAVTDKEERQLAALKLHLLMTLRARVAAAPAGQPVIIRWISPDSQYEAHCVLVQDKRPEQIEIVFMTSAGEPALRLGNQPVWLADLESKISAEGKAWFPSDGLLQALESGKPPCLAVGSSREVWEADLQSIPPDLVEALHHESGTDSPSVQEAS
jgi:hypothetical protein